MILFLAQNIKKRDTNIAEECPLRRRCLLTAPTIRPQKKKVNRQFAKKHLFLWGGFSQMRR